MADNINVNPTGSTPVATDDIGGVHYQKVLLVNENGDVGQDIGWLARTIMKVFGRFSFSSTSELRTNTTGTVTISSGTVTTVTTGNIGFGDQGKASAAMSNSASMYYNSVRRNFI